jgi:selenocysteine lyase/cysteine desulfurase
MQEPGMPTLLETFRRKLDTPDPIATLQAGLIGDDAVMQGPFGPRKLIYADYTASGRALRQVEEFLLEKVLLYYANSHTEASYCGQVMTRLRAAARAVIASQTGAGEEHAVIFAGSGATAGINKLVDLFGIPAAVADGQQVVVFLGPYEHHSNILPWRESGAEIIAIPEGAAGGPDAEALREALERTRGYDLRVGAFSAASNVTGIITDVAAVTRQLKAEGVLAAWDYACAGPYLDIAMTPAPDSAIDAVVVSPHKFPGGPGASGVLIVRRDAVAATRPTAPGGGTVRFVSPWFHDYSPDVVSREEAGTPNVIGDIRAALAFLVKAAVGTDFIARRHAQLNARALAVWQKNPNLELLGIDPRKPRLPIFSFRVRDGANGLVHHQLFTRMLSDCHGIQARGGCACAGPYGLSLLGIDRSTAELLWEDIRSGREVEKPGWVRLNFSYLMSDAKADFVIEAVDALARNPLPVASTYICDTATARFSPAA